MKKLVLILVFTTLFACDKSNETEGQSYGVQIDAHLEFSIINSQKEDLLNPENPNHMDVSSFKLFYVIDGEKKEVYNPNYDNPRNFMIYKHENEYRIGISLNLNHSEMSSKTTTYIQWNNNDTDTLEALFGKTPNGIFKTKIWLNGELIWERGDNPIDAYFVLTK